MKVNLPKISVVIPVLNGGNLVEPCLTSLTHLNYPQNMVEIILVDGGSTDQTKSIARKFPVKLVNNRQKIVVAGRNVGLDKAGGDLVAFSDIDCTFSRDWLTKAVKYFSDPRVGGVSGPNYIPPTEKPFSRAVGLIFDMAYFFKAGSPTGQYSRVIESRSHGSNAIYRRSVLKKIFPIDETLVEGEDVLMTEKIRQLGFKLLYVPDVIVYHYRRSQPHKWKNQMMRYAQAKILLERRGIRQVTLTHRLFGWGLPLLIGAIIAGIFRPVVYLLLFFLALIGGGALLIFGRIKTKNWLVGLNLVYAMIIAIYGWSIGYLRELWFASGKKWVHQ